MAKFPTTVKRNINVNSFNFLAYSQPSSLINMQRCIYVSPSFSLNSPDHLREILLMIISVFHASNVVYLNIWSHGNKRYANAESLNLRCAPRRPALALKDEGSRSHELQCYLPVMVDENSDVCGQSLVCGCVVLHALWSSDDCKE